jgi:hypothetical protein
VPRTEFLSSPAAVYRPRRPAHLRQTPPGELGKVIGLDRVPEVRTLWEKITLLAKRGDPAAWMRELAKNGMANDPEEAGYLDLDGHVRVYHGEQAKLPRRYVSRERLCLRGTTDGAVRWISGAIRHDSRDAAAGYRRAWGSVRMQVD